MDKFIVFYIWFLSLMGAAFYGHEFGIMKGEHETRVALNYKLENCNRIIADK